MHRVLAAAIVVAAILLQVGLAAGSWARATYSDGDAESALTVDLSGDVEVDPEDSAVGAALSDPQRAALRESVGGALRQLTQVLAALMMVIAAVGVVLDLTPRTWTLVSAVALSCLVTAVLLRDRAVSALAMASSQVDLGPFRVSTTGWSGLTIGAAAAATLAAVLAAAPRPASTAVIAEEAVGGIDDGTGGDAGGLRGRIPWPARGRRAQQLPP